MEARQALPSGVLKVIVRLKVLRRNVRSHQKMWRRHVPFMCDTENQNPHISHI